MITKAKNKDTEKLVKNAPADSLKLSDLKIQGNKFTNKQARIRRIPEPRIRPHKVKGREYYFYIEGDNEIYLGSAESILGKVKG